MNVALLDGGSGASINPGNGTVSGGAYNGYRVMMTFGGANGADHAVVVTGTSVINGVTYVNYYDPTINQPGSRLNNDYSGLYAVGAMGTSPFSGPGYGGGGGS